MTSPNHIAAGTFFTGFWCSFWNVNIFSRWEYIAATVVCSLIPDIDHPRSPLGILIYPIAKWIDKKYGHRTITHSLAFLFIGTAAIYFTTIFLSQSLSTKYSILNTSLTIIFFFSVLSHLILDMLTIQGVPLFYPVKRNPCVIPGNQDYRFVSGKPRTELVAFLIFTFANFLCWDLYAKGFWTHYNQIFTTIEHMHYERADSPNFTVANYYFIRNGKEYKGKAVVITSSEKTCHILINDTIFKLDYITPGLVVKSIIAEKTPYPYSVTDRSFINAPVSDLQAFIAGQIVSGTITSNDYFTTHFNGTQKAGNNITLSYDNHVSIVPTPTVKPNQKDNIAKQLAIKKQSLIQQQINFKKHSAEYYRLLKLKDNLQNKVNNETDLTLKNTFENELIKLHNKLLLMPVPVYQENTVTVEEIKQLQIQLAKPDSATNQTFTANLSIVNIPKELINPAKKR